MLQVKANQAVGFNFCNSDPSSGAGIDPTTPGTATTAKLYIDGVQNAAAVTLVDDPAGTTGITKGTFTVPGTVAEGNHLQVIVSATVAGVLAPASCYEAMVVTRFPGELALATNLDTALTALSSILTDVVDIQTKVTTTGVAVAGASKTGYALTSAYDLAKTAAQASDILALLTHQMTESYAAKGTAPTLAQALCMALALLGEKVISGNTLTANQLDGSTPAATFDLAPDSAPAAFNGITRAS